jgi:predicted TIM-barrel fold metal-dependent hydrolase
VIRWPVGPSDKLFVASDYPHFDAKFPDSMKTVLDRTDLTDDQKRLMLSENPARFYKAESLIAARR